jgi:hypothetical protein
MSRLVGKFAAVRAGAAAGNVAHSVVKFPSRSELAFLNETIPLFYIGRNRDGFWVARDADGRSGGIFFFKASAVRFARAKTAPAGCALMFLNASFELDRDNEGSQAVEILGAAIALARRRVPTLVWFVEMAIAEWRKLLAQLSRAVAGERRHRAAVERELFHGHYRLASKIDDDLPPQ